MTRSVTFCQFRIAAKRRGWTPEALAGQFGAHDGLFFRMWEERYNDVVIPYRKIIEAYEWLVTDTQKSPQKTLEIVEENDAQNTLPATYLPTPPFGGVFSPPLGQIGGQK